MSTVPLRDDTDDTLARALDVLAGRRIAVLTGAGVSTDSGIPDYRGAGAPVRTPMTMQQFRASEAARRRYWVGSHLGWRVFAAALPNGGHRALCELEAAGVVSGVVTQNVDSLHLRAGSGRVVELHGTMRRVLCTRCGQVFDRRDLARRVEADNPWLEAADAAALGPDGDVRPEASDAFVVPACSVCGGILKPDVVFFGEFVPAERFREAEQLVRSSDALVVAGSSLAVNSGMRLVERALRAKRPVVVVNRGATHADARATVKVEAGTTPVLASFAAAFAGARGTTAPEAARILDG